MATQENCGPTNYGDELADVYDNWIVRLQDDTEDTVRVLAEPADRGHELTGVTSRSSGPVEFAGRTVRRTLVTGTPWIPLPLLARMTVERA
jgi:hypothetical protein